MKKKRLLMLTNISMLTHQHSWRNQCRVHVFSAKVFTLGTCWPVFCLLLRVYAVCVKWVVASPKESLPPRRRWRGIWIVSSPAPSATTRSHVTWKCKALLWSPSEPNCSTFPLYWVLLMSLQGEEQKYWHHLVFGLPGGVPDSHHMYPVFTS